MALRNIIEKGDKILEKHCRPVTEFNDKLHTLLDDMGETLAKSGGVGLAAPQVGILRRVILVLETNVPEGEEEYIIELINPELLDESGTQEGPEGCLSLPGVYGWVERPEHVRIRAQDRDGCWFEVDGDGLTARAFCHELDHLEGIMFDDMADHIMSDEELDAYYGEENAAQKRRRPRARVKRGRSRK
ncbi:MAG: peptide deformylase [Oscillospiraceae bacterium]|nr:peptide deformylase [Oscillospiraceae bacterium]